MIDKGLVDIDFFELEAIRRKFELLDINKIDSFVRDYVNYLIKNINISIFERDFCSAVDLVLDRKLEGFCLETTDILICNFNDDDYICRGNLFWTENSEKYFHSWINFTFGNEDYVFDPSLSFLCLKELYDKLFNVEVMHTVSSIEVRDRLLYYLNRSRGDLIRILGTDNIEDPFYRVNAKVCGKVKKNNIISLYAKY